LSDFEQGIFKRVVDALAFGGVAKIPAVGLLEAGGEIAWLQFEHALGLVGDHGDGGYIEVIAEVELWAHGVAAGEGDLAAGYTDNLGFFAGGAGQGMDDFFLGEGAGVSDIESVADGLGMFEDLLAGEDEVGDVDELHEAAAIAGEDEGAAGAEAIPEEGFAVIVVTGPIDEGRAEGDDGDVIAVVHAEEHALAHGLIADIGVGVVIGGEGVGFMVIEAVAVGGDGRHEDVFTEVAFEGLDGVFDLGGGGAAFPVVDVIEDDIELFASEDLADLLGVVAVGDDIADFFLKRVGLLAVQDGDIVLLFEKVFNQQAADELGAADYKNTHAGGIAFGERIEHFLFIHSVETGIHQY